MANNPGGDQDDGTVGLPMCPYCKKLFFYFEEMVTHIAQHEGGKQRKGVPTNEQALNENDAEDLKRILRSKF